MKKSTLILIVLISLLLAILLIFLNLSCLAKLKDLLMNIILAFLTSSIFYYITVTIKEERTKNNILPFVADNLLMIIIRDRAFFKQLQNESGEKGDDSYLLNPDKETIADICEKIQDTSKKADYDESIYQFLDTYFHNLEKKVDNLLAFYDIIDSELRAKLLKIKKGLNDKNVNFIFSKDKGNLKFLSNDLIKLHNSINELSEYCEQNLDRFLVDNSVSFKKLNAR